MAGLAAVAALLASLYGSNFALRTRVEATIVELVSAKNQPFVFSVSKTKPENVSSFEYVGESYVTLKESVISALGEGGSIMNLAGKVEAIFVAVIRSNEYAGRDSISPMDGRINGIREIIPGRLSPVRQGLLYNRGRPPVIGKQELQTFAEFYPKRSLYNFESLSSTNIQNNEGSLKVSEGAFGDIGTLHSRHSGLSSENQGYDDCDRPGSPYEECPLRPKRLILGRNVSLNTIADFLIACILGAGTGFGINLGSWEGSWIKRGWLVVAVLSVLGIVMMPMIAP